jgi:Lrp/AsnC family leucine-responsive transcriptional regulator
MQSIPDRIKKEYEKLRKQYPFYVALKPINGKYYLYKQISRRLENRKTKVISQYLGRINEDGVFIKKASSNDTELENAAALILAHGGKVVLPEKTEAEHYVATKEFAIDEKDEKLLTILSMNARIPYSALGKEVGLSPTAVEHRIEKLEEQYGIHYLAEVNTDKLGYLTFIAFAKFIDKKPTNDELKAAAKSESAILLMANTKGEYDLILYILAETSGKIADLIWRLRSESPLKKYNSRWHFSAISQSYGFVPLTTEFFDDVLKTKIWKRTKEKTRPDAEELLQREFSVMHALNSHGKEDFSRIEKRYSLGKGSARYTYENLLKKKMIDRITLNMRHLPINYVGVILLEYTIGEEFAQSRAELLKEIMELNPVSNKYVLEGAIGIPNGILIFMPVVDNNEFDKAVEFFRTKIRGINVQTSVITSIVSGSFCYRRFDNAYSLQHKRLVEKYGMAPLEPTYTSRRITT